MKNRKGSTAALLTLGLVLIGSLVTLGVSFLTNNNKKIASYPRASECTSGAYVNEVDCLATCGEGNCTSCDIGGIPKWQCSNASSLNPCTEARTYYDIDNCTAEHPIETSECSCTQCLISYTPRVECKGEGGPIGASGVVPVTCNTAYSTCNAQFGASFGNQQFWQKGDLYYSKEGCSTKVDDNDANTLPGSFKALTGWCKSFQGQICGDVTCEDKYGSADGIDADLPLKVNDKNIFFPAGSSCIPPAPSDAALKKYCFPQSDGGGGGGGGGGNTGVVTIGNLQYIGCGVGTVLPATTANATGCASCGGAQSDCARQPIPGDPNNEQFFCCASSITLP